jgi:hypothetical protein
MRAGRYLAWYAIAALLLSGLVILVGVFADPYRVFGTPTFAGVNEIKPRIYQESRLAKVYQLVRVEPRTLVLGNSRAEIGFDPASPAWPDAARPVFNAAQAGSGIDTAIARLRCASATHRPELVILGLDVQDFLTPPSRAKPGTPGAAPDRSDGLTRCGLDTVHRWKARARSTLTISALSDSLATLAGQDPDTGVTMEPNGFNPLRDYRVHVRRIGHFGLFAQKNEVNDRAYARRPKPNFDNPDSNEAMRELRQFLKLGADNQIKLVLFIHPYHADFLHMLDRLGFWPAFESWKRKLVELASAESGRYATPIRIIDFSGYSQYATEPVPPEGDTRTEMRWYWEPGHYKSSLGNLMLAQIFGGTGFGTEVTASNLEAHLAALRAQRDGRARGAAAFAR